MNSADWWGVGILVAYMVAISLQMIFHTPVHYDD